VTLQAECKPTGYPKEINTLRDHLLKRILDLDIEKREAAMRIGVRPQSLTNWLAGRSRPGLYLWPKVIEFLGYDPRPVPRNLGERLHRWRQERGISQEGMAKKLGVDPGTLSNWEKGVGHVPKTVAVTWE
jgi:transcriptional regulator with XRE-family HTH domain